MKSFLIISQILYTICFVPWLLFWGLSFMVFDGGIAFWNSLFFLAISMYPIAVIGCSITSWLFRKRRKRAAIIVNLIPILWVGGLGIPLLIINLG